MPAPLSRPSTEAQSEAPPPIRLAGDLFDPAPGIREVRVRGVYTDYEHDEAADGVVGQTYRNKEFDGRVEVLHAPIMTIDHNIMQKKQNTSVDPK